MAITKTEKGWLADIQPGGRGGKRYRKTFKTKAEAQRYEVWLRRQHTERPEWEPQQADTRRLTALVARWYVLHGQNLKDGANRHKKLLAIAKGMGDPRASSMSAKTFTEYRATRLEGGTSPNTVNHELAYLRACFNELERMGEWAHGNPIAKVRALKIDEQELTWLTTAQITALLEALSQSRNKDARLVALVCLATGARWSEAETLRAEQVTEYLVSYWGTKSGKGRAVPISPGLYREIKTKKQGRLFGPCYQAFENAVTRAGLELPRGQMTHILRHTFASHFMQRGGNILALQKILGHASLTMTMRYAHLAPDHLEEARSLNPVSFI